MAPEWSDDPLKREEIKFSVRLPTGVWRLVDEKEFVRLQKRFTRLFGKDRTKDATVYALGAEAYRWELERRRRRVQESSSTRPRRRRRRTLRD